MADFDPDAYLATKKASFDPDAYLAGKKNEPTTAAPDVAEDDPNINRIDLNAPQESPKSLEWKQLLGAIAGMATGSPQATAASLAGDETKSDFLTGAIEGATLGAAPAISRRSAVVQGFSPHGADAVYKEARERSPWAHMAGRTIGSLPAALATGGTSVLGQAAGGVGLSMLSGFLGSDVGSGAHDTAGEWSPDNIEGKAYDAVSQGFAAAPLAIGLPVGLKYAPKIASSSLSAPKAALDKFKSLAAPKPAAAPAAVADDVAAQAADNVVPLRPDQADVETKAMPFWRKLAADEEGAIKLGGGNQAKFKSKKDAWNQIVKASGVDDTIDDLSTRSHGQYDEIERVIGRKVKNARDAFDGLVAESAKKRGKIGGTHDWEDVQTAIRKLKEVDGLERLQLPSDVQDAILPVEKEPSFNFGFNAKAQPPAKDPAFLKKSGEIADMLAADSDTVVSKAPIVGDPNIAHKGAFRGSQGRFPSESRDWLEQPHAWKAGEDDRPVGGVMDLLMADSEGPNTQAAIEALNKGERNMTKWRNPADVDSSVKRFPEPVSVDELIGQKTNPKGSTASLYEPMGAPAAARVPQPQPAAAFDEFNPPSADEMRPRWDRAQAETNAIALERFPQLSGQREATPDEFGLWSAALDRLKRRGLMNAAEDASAGTQVLASNPAAPGTAVTKTAAPGPQQAAQAQSPSQPWSSLSGEAQPPAPGTTRDPDAERIAAGGERIRKWVGYAGGAAGAWGGFKSGGVLSSIGGAVAGQKAAVKSYDAFETTAEWLAKQGQKILGDPAKLTQLAQQGGQAGKAAAFVLEGQKNGGAAGMAARAFIIGSQPWWRQMFADPEQLQQ